MEEITNCCICDDGEWTEGVYISFLSESPSFSPTIHSFSSFYAFSQDPIVFCDGCDMGAHVQCYGAPLSMNDSSLVLISFSLAHGIPRDEWYCENCKHNARDAVPPSPSCSSLQKCILCPKKGGAMKRTIDGRVFSPFFILYCISGLMSLVHCGSLKVYLLIIPLESLQFSSWILMVVI